MNYFLKIILLENCPYSIALNNLIKTSNIPNKSIWINSNEKNKYKTEHINTFPQIYLNKFNSKENLVFNNFNNFNSFYNVL